LTNDVIRSLPTLVAVALVAALATWLGTSLVRRFAISAAMLDVPGHRSSHRAPTPRGGGLAIFAVVLVGLVAAGASGLVARRLAVALVGGGVPVAMVGWLDDRRGLGAVPRVTVHTLAAAWCVYWLGGWPTLELGVVSIPLGVLGGVLAAAFIVWSINLYNFMDGIDGIAAGQAVVVGVAGAALVLWRGYPSLAFASLLVGASAGGFLRWNWQPARIFMGDVGSGLLGFLVAALGLAADRAGAAPLAAWALLYAPFIADATVTLLRRVARRERWYDAHRSHAYQRAVQSGLSHAAVTWGTLLLSAAHVPLAVLATARPTMLPLAAAVSAIVLTGAYLVVERRQPMTSESGLQSAAR
jgi:Fuc2NAc and GlcNAc transferase